MRASVPRLVLLCVLLAPTVALAQGPIKIGFISPMTGAIAQAGKDMYSGCELYWQETGWQVGGRKLEVILEGNEGLPATGEFLKQPVYSREFPPCKYC